MPTGAPRSLRYSNLASGKASEILRLDKDFAEGLSVSPDGRWLLFSQVDEEYSNIMLVNYFNQH